MMRRTIVKCFSWFPLCNQFALLCNFVSLLYLRWLLNQHIRVVLLVVVVVKLHDASCKRTVSIRFFLLVNWHHHWLFDEMCCVDHCISMQLLEVLYFSYSIELFVNIALRFDVWVSSTVFNWMPNLLAALALHVFQNFNSFVLFGYLVLVLFVFLVVCFGFVLVKLTSRLVSTSFTAAPPHFTTPFRLMNPAGPVEIFFLNEFLLTILTDFLCIVELAFSCKEPNNIFFHFFFLIHKYFVRSVLLLQPFSKPFIFTCS